MHRGYVTIHRKMLDNPVVFKDADHLAVWIYLMLNATHKNYSVMFGGASTVLLPGQLITGRLSIAKKLKINDSKVKRILILFKNEQLIAQQTTNQNSLITLVSWSMYQKSDQQNDQRVTSDCPASDQRVTTNKNVKKVNNPKNENKYSDDFENFWKEYPRAIEKVKAFKKWLSNLSEKANPEEMILSAKNYSVDCKKQKTEVRFIKHPATFLNESWKEYKNKPTESGGRSFEDQIAELESMYGPQLILKGS